MAVPPEAPPRPGPGGLMNDPIMTTPPPGMMPPMPPGMMPPNGGPPGTDQVAAAVSSATASRPPVMEDLDYYTVTLPAGWISPENVLVQTAQVRELTGYDEERLARIDMLGNVATYVTELLTLAVEDLGGQKPSKEVIQSLLIGDRDALVLGIRQATYGNEVEYKLNCAACGNDSLVGVEIDKDVEVITMDEPRVREFTVPLKHGEATVVLLTGRAQEAFSDGIGKKTQAEITTVMLAKSVTSINGKPVMSRNDDVQQLSAADRSKLTDFIAEHQPGPQLNKEIMVSCAVCSAEYPVSLGLPALFRL